MIAGCFGSEDKKFAKHPCDLERAIELLKECSKNSISLIDLKKEVENYLKNNLAYSSQNEIDKITNYLENASIVGIDETGCKVDGS